MNQTERLYRIDQLLRSRQMITRRELLEVLECSQATLTRDIEHLRSRLHAPIIFDSDLGAYRLEDAATGPSYALPGLWFNDTEISALLTIIATGATPDDEREFGVEGGGTRSRKFLVARPRKLT